MSDCWMMLHTLPISIQPAVNWPTVKHAGPASRCHTWRFWPQIKTQWTSLLLPHLTLAVLSSRQLSLEKIRLTSITTHISWFSAYLHDITSCKSPHTHSPSYWSNFTSGWVNTTLLPVRWAVTALPIMKEINQGAVLICSCYPSHY